MLTLDTQAQYFPELKFQKFFGTPNTENPYRLVRGADRDLYLIGSSADATGNINGVIYKTNQDGEFKWAHIIKGEGREELRDAFYYPQNDEIYFCGNTGSELTHEENADKSYKADYLIGKISGNNKLAWKKVWGGNATDISTCIIPFQKGVWVAGSSWSSDGRFECTNNKKPLKLNNNAMFGFSQFGSPTTQYCWGGARNDWATSMYPTDQGGMLIAGVTTSEDLDNSQSRMMGDAWIQKADSSGKILWTKIFKEPNEDKINRIIEGRGNFIYAVGSSYVNDKDQQFWMIKSTKDGEILLNKKWGTPGNDELTAIYETFDGGLIVTGTSFNTTLSNKFIKGGKDLWVMRIDVLGNIVWQKTYGGPFDESGIDILEGADHDFFILGKKENRFDTPNTSQKEDFWLLKVYEHACSDIQPFFITDLHSHEIEINDPVKFINQSKFGERWLWDFGDGTTSTEKLPIKSYKKPGNYLVRLTAYMNDNCAQIYVYPNAIMVR